MRLTSKVGVPLNRLCMLIFCSFCLQGFYAVGNFQPSEDTSTNVLLEPHRLTCSLPHISQEAALHHMQMKASMSGETILPTSHSEGLLHRGLQQQSPEDGLKQHSDVDTLSPRSHKSKDAYMSFSHTLPRVHTPQAIAAYEEAARRHAATLHHTSLDSSRSKQLLSQWKSKNHKCSSQIPDSFSSSLDSSSGHSSQKPPHHGSMDRSALLGCLNMIIFENGSQSGIISKRCFHVYNLYPSFLKQ